MEKYISKYAHVSSHPDLDEVGKFTSSLAKWKMIWNMYQAATSALYRKKISVSHY